jgi:hypothetical protein
LGAVRGFVGFLASGVTGVFVSAVIGINLLEWIS